MPKPDLIDIDNTIYWGVNRLNEPMQYRLGDYLAQNPEAYEALHKAISQRETEARVDELSKSYPNMDEIGKQEYYPRRTAELKQNKDSSK